MENLLASAPEAFNLFALSMGQWKPNETAFEEYDARIVLPGRWQPRPSDNPLKWIFRSADHREHVTITRHESLTGVEPGERNGVLRRAATKHYRATELGLRRIRDTEIGEVEYGEIDEMHAAWYSGMAGVPVVQFWAWIWCGSEAIWSLVYEATKLKEGVAEAHAEEIVDGISSTEMEEEW